MLFRSFGHRLLLIFGVFVLVVVVILAARIGLLGFAVQLWVSWAIDEIEKVYGPNKGEIDFAAKAIGAMGTLLGAAWTVHKGWHYAERNLPERLKEFNRRWQEATITSRQATVPALGIETIRIPSFDGPGPLGRAFSWLYDPNRKALAKWETAIAQHENDLLVLTSGGARCKAEVQTAYLTLGTLLGHAPGRGKEALEFFKRALAINGEDLDALELAGKQAVLIDADQAKVYFGDLAAAAMRAGDRIRQSRGIRFRAEVLLRHGATNEWQQARDALTKNLELLENARWCEPIARKREAALTHELLAEVQLVRERFSAARSQANSARGLFKNSPAPWGPAGLDRLKVLMERIDEASKDPEDPTSAN